MQKYCIMSRIMKFLTLLIGVIPVLVTSIQISSNGNSPEIKMVGGMMIDVQKRNVHEDNKLKETPVQRDPGGSKSLSLGSTKLAINERYRRLIPYMTFYYANDLTSSTTEGYVKSFEIEKAEIVEAPTLVTEQLNQRQPKRIVYSVFRDIPRYQGNRLTQYNIASANPARHYKETLYQNSINVTPNYNPFISGYTPVPDYDTGRHIQKQTATIAPFAFTTRKPQFHYYNEELSDLPYLSEKDVPPKYKLVPYQQTPPVKVPHLSGNVYNKPRKPIPVPVLLPKDQIYVPRTTARPQYLYDSQEQKTTLRKPTTISENYYEKQRPQPFFVQPVIEGGFKPMMPTTELPQYSTLTSLSRYSQYENERPQSVQVLEEDGTNSETDEFRPKYYQYNVDQPTYDYQPQYVPLTHKMTLGDLIKTLQKNKSLPEPITKENIASSIRTLLQALNALKAKPVQNEVEPPILSTPQPFDVPKVMVETDAKPVIVPTMAPVVEDTDINQEPYLPPINPPSQHLDDYPSELGSSQQFPLPITSDDEGGTPGQPGVDYPVLPVIPHTSFDCKTQRYKGFFADTETRCQVWHYCDLNGGQASFLCPNGTIFSQAALTCDWWFNVRCASTTQLYVLNESLYKFILPHTPKFPEDYSGPLVDKYLTLKFKEMEEEFRKKKNKSAASDKEDSDESDESTEVPSSTDSTSEASTIIDGVKSDVTEVNVANVVIGSPGESGNVERLHK